MERRGFLKALVSIAGAAAVPLIPVPATARALTVGAPEDHRASLWLRAIDDAGNVIQRWAIGPELIEEGDNCVTVGRDTAFSFVWDGPKEITVAALDVQIPGFITLKLPKGSLPVTIYPNCSLTIQTSIDRPLLTLG